jgi:hypothetical protein
MTAAAKRKRSSAKNDVQGAALAIVVLNFVRPYFRDESSAIAEVSGHDDLTRRDGYEMTVERIIADYCPLGVRIADELAISSEACQLRDLLQSSKELMHALANEQPLGARRRGAK